MPTVKDKTTGNVVSEQPYTTEGTQKAEQIADTDPNWEVVNAPDTRETYHMGGQVPGQPGFGERPGQPGFKQAPGQQTAGLGSAVSQGLIKGGYMNHQGSVKRDDPIPDFDLWNFEKGGKVKK